MSDGIEESLATLAERLTEAWRAHEDSRCPLGELAALAAATLTFYRENRGRQDPTTLPHWTALLKPGVDPRRVQG